MDHDQASLKLTDLALSHLSPAEAAAVESHAAACADCRETLEFIRRFAAQVKSDGDFLFDTHPLANDLVAWATRSPEMTAEAREAVERHVASCPSCRREADLTRRVAAEASEDTPAASRAPDRSRQPKLIRLARPVDRWRTAALAAAAALLALIYPAYRGLVKMTRHPVPAVAGGNLSALVLFGESSAVTEDTPQVRLLPHQDSLPVVVAWIPSSSLGFTGGPGEHPEMRTTRIVSKIRRLADDAVLWTAESTMADSWDVRSQQSTFLVPTRGLSPGLYRLEIAKAGADQPDYSTVFRVTEQAGQPAAR